MLFLKVLLIVLLVSIGSVIAASIPDIKRYLKIRQM